jgi:hypothetical protein
MTKLYKPVRRTECGYIYDGGHLVPIMVEMRPPNVIALKIKGRRKWFTLTTDVVYSMAVKADVADEKRQKAKQKAKKKRRRRKGERK